MWSIRSYGRRSSKDYIYHQVLQVQHLHLEHSKLKKRCFIKFFEIMIERDRVRDISFERVTFVLFPFPFISFFSYNFYLILIFLQLKTVIKKHIFPLQRRSLSIIDRRSSSSAVWFHKTYLELIVVGVLFGRVEVKLN